MSRSMVISLIGRPNVGKSSLFNRLLKRAHKALTYDMPGVTRDRHYGIFRSEDYNEKLSNNSDAILVDTGGFYPEKVDENSKQTKQEEVDNHFFNIMTDQAKIAIEESDLVLFVVDVREGLLPFDNIIADYIRIKKKPFWVIVNKYDSDKQMGNDAEFYALGIDSEDMMNVSAAHGLGINTLRTRLEKEITNFSSDIQKDLQLGVTPKDEVVARVALIGAPNVGKSTLLNQLIGAKRALVSNIPGTTVDPIEGYFDLDFGRDAEKLKEDKNKNYSNDMLMRQYDDFRQNNKEVHKLLVSKYEEVKVSELDELLDEQEVTVPESELVDLEQKLLTDSVAEEDVKEVFPNSWRSVHLVDTAGIRKQKLIRSQIEAQSVYRSLRCITESDIVLYMIDATKGIGHHDRRLLDIALDKGKSVILCFNKMDLLRDKLKTDKDRREWILDQRFDIPWLQHCDLMTISAKYNKSIKALKQAVKKTILIRNTKVPTAKLNRSVMELLDKNPLVVARSSNTLLKVRYTSMVKSGPPTFLFFSNKSQGIPDNYRRYLQNSLRKEFGLRNSPIHLIFRTGADLEKRRKNYQDRT